MKTAVITGVSKGLGASIAKLLIEQGISVIGIARTENAELETLAERHQVSYRYIACDLSNLQQVEEVFHLLREQVFGASTEVMLINNAAMVDPINTAGSYQISELTEHVAVNLTAPMITTNLFVEKATESKIDLIVVNVTSGAAGRSVSGWSAYCSTKAGINRFTETVALEQADAGTLNKVILFDPSIMDTDMQGSIRASSAEAFKDVATFQQYQQDNSLRDTEVVAKTLVELLVDQAKIINGEIYSVKELL
ncbi:(S)-benzoin forming benzil reductase [Radiobacillus sp. PE A8.2]|uniref:(S)-benzoin forming benzil reductase n=1 Tax=Radiobacillus sp. PE A8.2 TaxID=3380349 RepID=UPI00388E6A8E